MFICFNDGHVLILLVDVDDISLGGNFDTHIHDFIIILSNKFAMKDLGPLHYFFGMEGEKMNGKNIY